MDLQNKIIGEIGRKGSGKSTLFKEMLRREKRLFVFNTMGEHLWVVDQIPDLSSVGPYLDSVADPSEKFQAAYTPIGEVKEEFDVVAMDVFNIGNMTFGIEELPMLTVSAGYMQPSLGRLFRLGRHRALNLVWTAQRAAEVPRGATGATDYFIFFQQTEPGDLKAIAYRCGEECANIVASLGLHEFVTFDVIHREIGGMQDFREEQDRLLHSTAIRNERTPLWKGELSYGEVR
jgi:hypothetical protein